jgi:acetyl esterase/lipase
MKRNLLLMLASVTLAATAVAQSPAWPSAPDRLTIPVWPAAAPGAPTDLGPEANMTTPKDNIIAGRPAIRIGNVVKPTLTLYKPKGNANGAAVVVFPGGGYRILAIDLEGTEVCDWLNSFGVTCVLLKYRVPNTGPYPKSPAALQDAQRAMGLVRQHAAEWSIDPNRIGTLGFSAGFTTPSTRLTSSVAGQISPWSSIPAIWRSPTRTSRPMLTFIPLHPRRPPSSCRLRTIRCTLRMRWSTFNS